MRTGNKPNMDTRGRNTWHTQQNPDITGRNSSTEEGGVGALEAPQDRHGQDHRTGTSRAEQMTEAMAELGAPKAMAGARSSGGHGGAGSSGGHGRWSFMAVASSLGQATPAGTLLPPKKKFPGEVRGYQEPSGARQTGQYMTGQDSPPGPDRQDKTSHRNRKPSWAS